MSTRRTAWVQAHPITTFYLLAFVISWSGWVPSLGASAGIAFFRHPVWIVCLILPALGPALAAKFTTEWQGQTSVPIRNLFRWRVSPKWYVVAVCLPLLVVGVANGLSSLISPSVDLAPEHGAKLAIFLLISLAVNPWEEVGWRGFALQQLQMRYSPLTATLLVGILWGVWHLPIFFIHEGPMQMAMIPFWPWFLGILGWSMVMTWLFNHAGSSLLICALCHVAGNGFGALLGTDSFWALSLVKMGTALVLWLSYGPGLKTASVRLGPAQTQ